MLNKIKKFIKKIKCAHVMNINRWHWVHFPDYEPLSVEIEYKCDNCGKITYIHLCGEEANKWDVVMRDYKKQ